MLLQEKSVYKKLDLLDDTLSQLGKGESISEVPELPGREITYLPINLLSGRIGISNPLGQQKLLHDLANIELQAMELGVRTLTEFPHAPFEFREELAQIVREEAKHLKLCLQAIESLGGYWGQWPVHLGLWHATHKKDSLLERLFIVHRYLEGSGLDAGDTMLRRLSGLTDKKISQVVKVIVEEEVSHVDFGSKWFRHFAKELKVDEKMFFQRMCSKLMKKHPRKDKISEKLRSKAGFNPDEIAYLNQLRLT